MLMDLFYARLTDAVYLMNLKRELQGDHNMEMFSNAALKMTEITRGNTHKNHLKGVRHENT